MQEKLEQGYKLCALPTSPRKDTNLSFQFPYYHGLPLKVSNSYTIPGAVAFASAVVLVLVVWSHWWISEHIVKIDHINDKYNDCSYNYYSPAVVSSAAEHPSPSASVPSLSLALSCGGRGLGSGPSSPPVAVVPPQLRAFVRGHCVGTV